METEKEIEVRKDSFRKFRDMMRESNLFRNSNRIGKNLSYVFYMSAWHHSRLELLKEIINELDYETFDTVVRNIYNRFDYIQEEVTNHEKI